MHRRPEYANRLMCRRVSGRIAPTPWSLKKCHHWHTAATRSWNWDSTERWGIRFSDSSTSSRFPTQPLIVDQRDCFGYVQFRQTHKPTRLPFLVIARGSCGNIEPNPGSQLFFCCILTNVGLCKFLLASTSPRLE